jgi:hypothetical protein
MNQKFNRGDLVAFENGYDNGRTIYEWCKVLDLIVNEISYDSYDIITSQGDLNTKIIFHLKPIGRSSGGFQEFTEHYKITTISKDDFYTDKSHSVYLIDTEYFEKLYQKMIESSNEKINFIRLNKNRNEKLDDLLGK